MRPSRDGFDVAVIGAGVVGTAIARELTRYDLSVVLLEANLDVGAGTSKANTGILHTGFDATPGSLEARLVRRGRELMAATGPELGIPIERLGALLVAWDDDQVAALDGIEAKARLNGYDSARRIDRDTLRQMEPRIGAGALAAIYIPDEGITCTFTAPLAFATQAVTNGALLMRNFRVAAVARRDGQTLLWSTEGEAVGASWVVNAGGLWADRIDALFGHDRLHIRPRRGELIVFDKFARPLVNHILLPVPTRMGKGVLVAPTVYGNVLLGPTAEDIGDRAATDSTAAGLVRLMGQGQRILPALVGEEVTAVYAGLRAATDDADYQIHPPEGSRYVCVGGIRSTGLTAALAIAEYVVDLLRDDGLPLNPRALFAKIRMPNIGESTLRPYQRPDLIAADPTYGRIVCHCERVTAGEVRDALASTIPPNDADGLRRRTRTTGGRCQGFYCGAAMEAAIAAKVGLA